MLFRHVAALLILFASCCAVSAQTPVIQSGNVTPTHFGCWTTNGVLQDCGSSAIPFATTMGTWGLGATQCADSANPQTAASYFQLCLGNMSDGTGSFISFQGVGGASGQLYAFINGAKYPFPFSSSGVIGPGSTVNGDASCWANTSGTLLSDCGAKISGPATTTVGDPACWNNGVGTSLSDCGLAFRTSLSAPTTYYVRTTPVSVTISNASPGVVTLANNGLFANEGVVFYGNVPTPINVGQIYYVVGSSITSNTFQISSTQGGSPINTTSSSSSVTMQAGSDSNNCLASTVSAACLTLGHMADVIEANVDLRGYQLTVAVAPGVYQENLNLGAYVGRGIQSHESGAFFQCTTHAAASCVIAPSSGTAVSAVETSGLEWDFQYFTFQGNDATASAIIADAGSWLQFDTIATTGSWAVDWTAENGGIVEFGPGGETLTGSRSFREFASLNGLILHDSEQITLNSAAYSNAGVYVVSGAQLQAVGVIYSGSATGTKWQKGFGGQIIVSGNPGISNGVALNSSLPGNTFGYVLDIVSGTFTRASASGNGHQSVTFPAPFNFSPTSCNFTMSATSTAPAALYGASISYVDSAFNPNAIVITDAGSAPGKILTEEVPIMYATPDVSTAYYATMVSWDANGFTINWTTIGSPSIIEDVNYRCQVDP